jgi:molecular chaperone GrpE
VSTEENNTQETGAEELQSEELETEQSPIEGEALEVEGDLVQLQAELEAAKDQALRTQAEMQNLRRRAERDVENAHKYALDKFVGELLPVVDNLERAIQTMDDNNDDIKVLSEGIELTLKSFQDVLARFKVEAVDPKGEVFNPEFHQAMSMLEMPDQAPNTVVDVFQKGYTLNGRLVRPAMVVVAKAAPNNIGEG